MLGGLRGLYYVNTACRLPPVDRDVEVAVLMFRSLHSLYCFNTASSLFPIDRGVEEVVSMLRGLYSLYCFNTTNKLLHIYRDIKVAVLILRSMRSLYCFNITSGVPPAEGHVEAAILMLMLPQVGPAIDAASFGSVSLVRTVSTLLISCFSRTEMRERRSRATSQMQTLWMSTDSQRCSPQPRQNNASVDDINTSPAAALAAATSSATFEQQTNRPSQSSDQPREVQVFTAPTSATPQAAAWPSTRVTSSPQLRTPRSTKRSSTKYNIHLDAAESIHAKTPCPGFAVSPC